MNRGKLHRSSRMHSIIESSNSIKRFCEKKTEDTHTPVIDPFDRLVLRVSSESADKWLWTILAKFASFRIFSQLDAKKTITHTERQRKCGYS